MAVRNTTNREQRGPVSLDKPPRKSSAIGCTQCQILLIALEHRKKSDGKPVRRYIPAAL
jgi:hypothetical protein